LKEGTIIKEFHFEIIMGIAQSNATKSNATRGKVVPAAYILGIIDVQNDFCKDGALEVPDAEAIVAPINKFRFAYAKEMPTFLTQDYHPENHMSFSTTHGKNPHETITYNAIMRNGDAITTNQILWPKHCVVGTEGADFHRDLIVIKTDIIIQKGQNAKVESYSAFGDEMGNKYEKTPLQYILQSKQITDIVLVGLATDYCVYNTALDAIRLGYHVHLIRSCTRGVAKNTTEEAMKDLLRKGAHMYDTIDDFYVHYVNSNALIL
jgi:nicotinamidase/pyrazinamidase